MSPCTGELQDRTTSDLSGWSDVGASAISWLLSGEPGGMALGTTSAMRAHEELVRDSRPSRWGNGSCSARLPRSLKELRSAAGVPSAAAGRPTGRHTVAVFDAD